MLGNALLAHRKGAFFVRAVLLHAAHIHGVRHARDRLERLDDAGIRHVMRAFCYLAALCSPGRFHDNVVPLLEFQLAGAEIVGFAVRFEADADHFCHSFFPFAAAAMGVSSAARGI